MGAHSKKFDKLIQIKKDKDDAAQTAKVLYQRMGDKWYAFSVIEDEVYMGAISEDEIESIRQDKDKKPNAKSNKNS